MEKFTIEINRTLAYQSTNKEMSYIPEDPYIRKVVIGIRPDEIEDDCLAYVECRFWNIANQKEATFWNYAREYEKNQEEKPFNGVCNYLRLKNNSKKIIPNNKTMSGWAVYVSELIVYDDLIEQYPTLNQHEMETEILKALPTILSHSFFIKPSYIFISDMELQPETLETAAFQKIGTVNAGKITLYMKVCK